MQPRTKATLGYILLDFIAASLAWLCFFLYRKVAFQGYTFCTSNLFNDSHFIYGILLVPVFWIILYAITGSYVDVFRRSRFYDIQYVFDGMRFYIKNYSFDHTPNYVIINQLGEKSIFDLRKMVKDSENYFRNERLYS